MEWESHYEGVINNLKRRYKQTSSNHIRRWIEGFMNNIPCEKCHGARLKPEALSVTINEKSISDLTELSIKENRLFFEKIKLSGQDEEIAYQILKEVRQRLQFLNNVGLVL